MRKALVIGLDCAAPDLLFNKFRNKLPNFERIMKKGRYGALESCDPPITIPAWAVMTSGKDPGTLGAYMIGCFVENTIPVDINCTPQCINSLKIPSNINSCDNLIVIYDGNNITTKNTLKTNKAILYYVGQREFRLDHYLSATLYSMGIRILTVLVQKDDSYIIKLKDVSLGITETENEEYRIGLVIFILFILFILFGCFIIFRKR